MNILLRWFSYQLQIHTPRFLEITFIDLINLILKSFEKRSAVVAETIFEFAEKGLLKSLFTKLTEIFAKEEDEIFIEAIAVFSGDMACFSVERRRAR